MGSSTAKPLVVRIMHWLVVGFYLLAFSTGLIAFDFDLKQSVALRDGLFAVHRASGILAAVSLLIWAIYRAARWFSAGAARRVSTVRVLQIGLGITCFAVPLLPWIARSLGSRTEELYSLLPKANLVSHPVLPSTYALLYWHKNLVWISSALILAHVAAATYHELWLRDGVVRSMLPRLRSGRRVAGRTRAVRQADRAADEPPFETKRPSRGAGPPTRAHHGGREIHARRIS